MPESDKNENTADGSATSGSETTPDRPAAFVKPTGQFSQDPPKAFVRTRVQENDGGRRKSSDEVAEE